MKKSCVSRVKGIDKVGPKSPGINGGRNSPYKWPKVEGLDGWDYNPYWVMALLISVFLGPPCTYKRGITWGEKTTTDPSST